MQRKAETKVDAHGQTVPPGSGVTPVAEFAPGSVVAGKYAIEHAIGEGGLGLVVKARHVGLDQPVAIKYLKTFAAAQPDVVERFMREARLAAKIKSEHAVKVTDVDAIPRGIPYMVMEYLEGQDLERIVAGSPLSVSNAIDFVLQASEALAEAHAAGIVHRDLKPGNLFLAARPGGSSIVKVLDFGISKMSAKDAPGQRRVTRIDERVGTPVYMSPEQLRSVDVDARSDIWALGVVLYELVTGKLPFDGPDLPQICTAILTQPPVPLAALNDDAPPELEAVIDRCLRKDPAERYQNVAELAQDLAQIWNGESPSRVTNISRVIRESGQRVAPPTPMPGSIELSKVAAALAYAAAPAAEPVPWAEVVQQGGDAAEDHVFAVFTDAAGAEVDQLEFLSIDEAYEYASSTEGDAVRCDLYDAFAGVRGRLRATYVRRDGGTWVPLIK